MKNMSQRVLIIVAIWSQAVLALADTGTTVHPFIAGYAGIQKPNVNGHIQVENGSNYPIPYNYDNYTTNNNTTATAALEAGYRWTWNKKYIPSYALSVRYQHIFSNDIGNTITQYSLNDFTNYTYRWNVVSDVFVLLGKFDLIEWNHFMPYVTAGMGVTFNRATNYNESPLPGITPRVSPGFKSNTQSNFTYQVGGGLDWQINANFITSIDYAYQDLGCIASKQGTSSWSTSSLSINHYYTNTFMLGLTYII